MGRSFNKDTPANTKVKGKSSVLTLDLADLVTKFSHSRSNEANLGELRAVPKMEKSHLVMVGMMVGSATFKFGRSI